MKTLLVLRHAKSSWSDARLADHDRPLSNRGKEDAPRMGRLLRALDLVPDLIITSTAVRARSTAVAVAEACGYEEEVLATRYFYHADPEEYTEFLRRYNADVQRIMVVGHNPGMEELVEMLGGRYERMPTAALAMIDLDIVSWADLDDDEPGKLVDVWRPREVGQ